MKLSVLILISLALGGLQQEASAQGERRYTVRHCDTCVRMPSGYRYERTQCVRYERVRISHRRVVVGYRNVWVYRTVIVWECGQAVEKIRLVLERTPIYSLRPAYELRPVRYWKVVRVPTYEFVCYTFEESFGEEDPFDY